MGYKAATIGELGDGYGFRKVRAPLSITAFGANVIVMAPGTEGFSHYHDIQDELYFVHKGTARFVVGDDVFDVGEGGLVHVESTTHRKFSNIGDGDLVVLAIGAKDGYVERDGHLVDPADAERRAAFGKG